MAPAHLSGREPTCLGVLGSARRCGTPFPTKRVPEVSHGDRRPLFEDGRGSRGVEDLPHKGEIDLESFSWGETNQGTAAAGGGGGAGKVSMQDFHFVTRVNKASPVLFLSCASGKHIKEAILTVRKAGKDQQDYLVFKFKDVLVSSYQIGGGSRRRSRWSRCRSTSRASTSSTAPEARRHPGPSHQGRLGRHARQA